MGVDEERRSRKIRDVVVEMGRSSISSPIFLNVLESMVRETDVETHVVWLKEWTFAMAKLDGITKVVFLRSTMIL